MSVLWPTLVKRRGYRTEIPMDMSAYGTGGAQYNGFVAHDAPDNTIYTGNYSQRTFYKMRGNSNELSSSMGWPSEFAPHQYSFQNDLQWYNGRFCMLFSRGNYITRDSWWIELNGWGDPDNYHNYVQINSSHMLWPAWRVCAVDDVRGWFVGVVTAYRSGYKDFLFKADYNTGAQISSGWCGRLSPGSNGGYQQGFVDADAGHIYLAYGNTIKWYDYTSIDARDTWNYPLGTITYNSPQGGGDATSLDQAGDLWLGNWGDFGGYGNYLWRYEGISNIRKDRLIT